MIKSAVFTNNGTKAVKFLNENSEKMILSENGATATYDNAVTVESATNSTILKLKDTDVSVNLGYGNNFVLRFMENDNGFTLVSVTSVNARMVTAIKIGDGYYLSNDSLLPKFIGKDKTLRNITRLPYTRETLDGEDKKIEVINTKVFIEDVTLRNPVEVTKFLDCTTIAKYKLYEIDGRNYYSMTENMLMEV